MFGHGFGRMLDQVNATAQQRAQIKSYLDAARAAVQPIHETARPLREQMAQLFLAPQVNLQQVNDLRLQLQGLREQAAAIMSEAMVNAANVLTQEQRQQLAALRAQQRSKWGGHWRGQQPAAPKNP
jgi:Spy/CpxP family protein refolding chaperone